MVVYSREGSCPAQLGFIHSVFCLTTGPKPPRKGFLHIVRSRASSFIREYPLLCLRSSSSFLSLLPCLLVTSISSCLSFDNLFRRQFLRKMWPIQLAFRFLISYRIFLCSLTLSNTSSFLTWSHSLGNPPKFITTVGKTYRSCQKHESVSLHDFLSTGRHLLGLWFKINLKVKFMYTSNHTEHSRKETYRTCTKDDCFSAQCIFNWNISVTGHKQRTVRFFQCKPPLRSSENSTVTDSMSVVMVLWITAFRTADVQLDYETKSFIQTQQRARLQF